MKKTITLLLLLLSLSSAQYSEGIWRKPEMRTFTSEWYIPDWAKVQYAGYLGFISVGAGYRSLFEYANFDLLYSYTPESLPNVYQPLHTISMKVTIPFRTIQLTREFGWGMSFGFNSTFTFGENILGFTQPDYYPSDYYTEQFFHVIPFLGSRFIWKTSRVDRVKAVEIYAELCALDDYLWYALTNDTVSLKPALGAGVGVAWHFRKKNNEKREER